MGADRFALQEIGFIFDGPARHHLSLLHSFHSIKGVYEQVVNIEKYKP